MYKKPTWAFYYAPRVQEALVEIRQLIEFCNMNKIEIDFVVNPMHITIFLRQDQEAYYNFLKGLSNLTSYWDFSGINEITTDNFYYYETSHFRTIIGDRMMDIVLEGKQDDFSQWITPQNIDEKIEQKRVEITQYQKE